MHTRSIPTHTAGGAAAAGRADVVGLLDALDTAIDDLAGCDLATADAGQLASVAQRVRRARGRLDGLQARAVTAAERTGVAEAAGAVGGAQWLTSVTGATPHAARRSETLGRAMADVPGLADAVADGRVDGEQASTLAAANRRGVLEPDDVARLVDEARHLAPGALAVETRRREARADQRRLRADEAHARARRRADWRTRVDGSVEGSFLLPAVDGQAVAAALQALVRPDPADTPDDLRRTPAQRRADALVDLARTVLDTGAAGTVRSVKPHVTVVVPVEVLHEELADAEGAGALGVLDDGTTISAAAARQVLCDADVRRVVVDPHGRPLDVGRATRTWSGAQRAALAVTDGGCRGPACDRPYAWTDLHHVRWWRHGGRTALDNALPLCRHCHNLVHHDGWHVDLDPSTRTATWTSPSGERTTTQPTRRR